MMLDTTDKRTVKALVLCAEAGQWLKIRSKDGQSVAYGVPSATRASLVHMTNGRKCSCEDAQRGNLCYHARAVALHCALVKALS